MIRKTYFEDNIIKAESGKVKANISVILFAAIKDNYSTVLGKTVYISEDKLFVETLEEVTISSKVVLSMFIPESIKNDKTISISCNAVVTGISAAHKGDAAKYLAECRLTDISKWNRDVLDSYLLLLKKGVNRVRSAQEKRENIRLRCCGVKAVFFDPERDIINSEYADVSNIGLGGVYMESGAPLYPYTDLYVTLFLPDKIYNPHTEVYTYDEPPVIKCSASIVRLEKIGGGFGMGVKFLKVDSSHKASLNSYLNSIIQADH